MSTVISVENLGKKYLLRHQTGQQPYVALRDVLSDGVRNLSRKLLGRNNLTVYGTEQEEFWALRDVSFEVKQGDSIGIIGRNGAGKSTLLKILSRITEPTTGRVRIKGRVASLLEVGTGFHPELTGRENIYLNGAILGMHRAEIKKKFDEIVDFAEIEKFLDTPVKRYSSGMYVRLAFAVAAHLEPEILVVDEVLAVGDAQFQKKCLGKMEDVSVKEGRTVLFVSHNMSAIRTLCSHALIIRDGQIVVNGSAAEVVSCYIGDLQEHVMLREWSGKRNPQGSPVWLRRVCACTDEGTLANQLFVDQPFCIVIEYEVEGAGASVGLTLLLYDAENNLVFSSINNLEADWYGKTMPAGRYRTTCHIPPDLLNNGWYMVSIIIFGAGFSDAQTISDILRLELSDSHSLRGDFFGEFGGSLRPRLLWKTVPID